MSFTWKLNDASGAALRTTQEFATQTDAEGWLGENWRALLDEGAETVTLLEDGRITYEMGLREA